MANFTGGEKLTAAYIKKIYKKFQAVDQDGSGRIEYPEYINATYRLEHVTRGSSSAP
ncbi:hypothetical protein Pmar_PMAR019634 [Perkinsus marinus ATCC 50983]|uniref:EF-hand domain-containing protein n=1 Tax=Perkinsus marinus (strain ATCC 50983 / TXsc) TaxID=423536 RepID=C5LF85_PERM5|nr:hypothetical protein Pmar_PMAR019634 [Perkinsus marinus ATCC 50983]EER04600.1 hypothetical protein Pmar_PMAR019634 [Perkinsus marinus ATCC 50983]|eukprot:XP_002772784.1 hypothetical protein Pmar_PMAR019634 [Perkinsus marinus ATCC 50983]